MAENLFIPVMGTEEKILDKTLASGTVYFSTDTRKIYLDVDEDHVKMPMGGNVGLFYGKMSLTSPPVDNQKEFEFRATDILPNDQGQVLLPNINDLILNSDGCFYKVKSVYASSELLDDTYLITEKLTIAGTGGSGPSTGPSDGSLGGLTVGRLRFEKGSTVLYKTSCPISFLVKLTDDLGDALTGNVGTCDVYINNIKQNALSKNVVGCTYEGDVTTADALDKVVNKNQINTIDVGPYLPNATNINVKIVVNGSNGGQSVRAGSVSTTNMSLTWDYDITEINHWTSTSTGLDLSWVATGSIEKIANIRINDGEIIEVPMGTGTEGRYRIDYAAQGLYHGAHKVEMWVSATIGAETVKTPSICKNIMVARENDYSTIISCNFFETNITQYNTIKIPIVIYDADNTGGNAVLTYIENGAIKSSRENVENQVIYEWPYTPMQSGTIVLTVQSGGQEETLTLNVESLDIPLNEKGDYAFKFKATEFAGNQDIQAWKSNNVGIEFNNFDWINGGLKTEDDGNGNTRQYVCVKAGSTMSIDYDVFKESARKNGKCLKVIFKATKCKDYDAQVLEAFDGSSGLVMNAQNATFYYGGTKKIKIPYCEDQYIEFELDISPDNRGVKRYIRPWMDGVPAGVSVYGASDSFISNGRGKIIIGSNDCDVYIYMIKLYEFHLTDLEHLDNFIADAPNATEILSRYNRNDILDDSNEISYIKLAEKNPNCFVHLYEIDRMTMHKKDPVQNCKYTQYKGSSDAVLRADGVTIKVQGTSSAAYGLAAFNFDSKFGEGFEDAVNDKHMDGWSMSKTAIPINFFCTKVNVASCEGSNNAINAEWYNKFQPYQTVNRGKRKGDYNTARDTMEFVPGVVFFKDNNPITNDDENENGNGGKGDNVFKDTPGYCDTVDPETNLLTSSYYKMYSIGCMGNSKDNVEVCHDTDNDFECCVENGDNQYPGQKMIDLQGVYTVGDDFVVVNIPDISEETKITCPDGIVRSARSLWEGAMDTIYGFRYPDGIEDVKKKDPVYAESMITGWYRLVNWMVHSNPQPAYEKIEFVDGYQIIPFKTKEEFKAELENNNIIYIKNNEGVLVEASEDDFNADNIYYMNLTAAEAYNKTKNDLWTWDNAELRTNHIAVTGDYDSTKDYFRKTPHVYGATDEKLSEPVTFDAYTFQGYKVPDSRVIDGVTYEITTKNEKGETVKANTFQADYTPMIKDKIVSTYAGTYEYDTQDYRMAKMLSECEEYLCMDSIIYHFLFIERHSMVDNVAKNTFWSTEDGLVWNLTKDYDNDTSDGNDNQGKLSLVYGYEPGDVGPDGASIFNAGNSVWLSFIGGLQEVCQPMFQQLDSLGAWSASSYLQAHNNFQKVIPERCWIEDYYRKYIRPYEVYNSSMFLEMHEGGQKTHQRAQYETYQNQYISSKYFGTTCRNNFFLIRSNGKSLDDIPVTLYADCYIRGSFGTGTDMSNLSIRCKRNTPISLTAPIDDASDGTVYIYPANLFQTMGSVDTGLNSYQLKQFDSSGARKLRTLALGIASGATNSTLTSVTFTGTENLEKLYVANFANIYGDLDLSDSPGLQYLDARNSNFSTVSIAKNAPIETMLLNCPSLINFSNLTKLKPLTNVEGLMQDWRPLYYVYLDSIDESGINSKNNILDPAFSYTGNRYETVYYKSAEEFEADEDTKYIKTSDDTYQEIDEYDATIGTYYKKLIKLKGYKLKNVKWTIDTASEVDLSNKTISILEKLKNSDTIVNDIRIETADALDGVLNVTATACGNSDSEDALAIYEKYSCSPGSVKSTQEYLNEEDFKKDTRIKYSDSNYTIETDKFEPGVIYYVEEIRKPIYPNLNINFLSENTTLYSVNIYDGDENLYWTRKIAPNSIIDANFLKYGPSGRFRSKDIQKSSTAQFEYVFEKKWIIKDDNGNEIATLDNMEEPMYTGKITQNLHFYPQFNNQLRHYNIEIKSKDPITKQVTSFGTQRKPFGTPLSEVVDGILPWADSSGLDDFAAYDFKGYGLIEDGTTPVSSNYVVTGDAVLWAVFKQEDDIRTITHPEWFEFVEYTYTYDSQKPPGANVSLYGNVPGLKIRPKNNLVLRGKIVIPAEATGTIKGVTGTYPVIAIDGFKNRPDDNITHVFMETNKTSNLLEVCSQAFESVTTLKYFDFINTPLRVISSSAFKSCTNLNVTGFNNNLIAIENSAFNGALSLRAGSTIHIPSSVRQFGNYSFAYTKIGSDCTLQFGSKESPSLFNISEANNKNVQNPFSQNDGAKFISIILYTNISINTQEAIDNFFVGALASPNPSVKPSVTIVRGV